MSHRRCIFSDLHHIAGPAVPAGRRTPPSVRSPGLRVSVVDP